MAIPYRLIKKARRELPGFAMLLFVYPPAPLEAVAVVTLGEIGNTDAARGLAMDEPAATDIDAHMPYGWAAVLGIKEDEVAFA